jgi:uncharacterized coiled-coil DUF342 family protein
MKGIVMLKVRFIFVFILTAILFQTALANDLKKELQKYINEIVTEVKDAETPEEKREILNDLFEDLSDAFETAKESPYVPENEHRAIDILKDKISERYNELNGLNGFQKVTDLQLNEFATFTLQDIEQADTVLTISLTTLLLIIILAILIF